MIIGSSLGSTPLGGGLGTTSVGGYVGVKLLQKALRDLAVKAQNSNVDPSMYDGTLTLGTIIALANTAPVLGKRVDPMVGKALDVVGLIKKPFEAIPYGESVINIILSPWLIDNVYEIVLAIIRLFPGGGSVATGVHSGVEAFKDILATAATPLAGAITLATTQVSAATNSSTIPTLGEVVTLSPTFASKMKLFIENTKPAGNTPSPERAISSGRVVPTAITPPMTAQQFIEDVKKAIIRDHRPWPKGKRLSNSNGGSDWDELVEYSAKVPLADLWEGDRIAWRNQKFAGHKDVARGTAAFRWFRGKRGQQLGAFWDERTQILKIKRITLKPSKKGHWYDPLADVVDDIGDFVQSSWDWVKENADDVYNAIKKYGCMVVNNDMVVAAVAGGAGIIATPAASGAILTGAGAGRAACTALSIGEAVYAIIKFLSMGHPAAPSLQAPPPSVTSSIVKSVLAQNIGQRFQTGSAGFSVVVPPTPPNPPLKPSDAFPVPPISGWTTLTSTQIAATVLGGAALGGLILRRL